MLYIDEIHACITTFLTKGGYNLEKDWNISAKYDTNASTRIIVHGMTFTNNLVPLVPAYKYIKVVEAWELCGGMEHGTTYIQATIWMIPEDASKGKTNFSYIENEEQLLGYLQTHFPTGEHIATHMQAARMAIIARQIEAAEATLNDRKAVACVKDEDIQFILLAIVHNAVSSGLSAANHPPLKERILSNLQERIKDVFARDFDRLLLNSSSLE